MQLNLRRPAVYEQLRSSHVAAVVGREENDRSGDLIRDARPAERGLRRSISLERLDLLIVHPEFALVCGSDDCSRAHDIHADVLHPPPIRVVHQEEKRLRALGQVTSYPRTPPHLPQGLLQVGDQDREEESRAVRHLGEGDPGGKEAVRGVRAAGDVRHEARKSHGNA